MEFVNPLEIPDWDERIGSSGDQAFFHTAAWARVLSVSYGYRPEYLVSPDRPPYTLVMPMMVVASRWTGTRGVSLPFTDACAPFATDDAVLRGALDRLIGLAQNKRWKYLEWRGLDRHMNGIAASEVFLTHVIDLSPGEDVLFGRLGENLRRNIRKAVREKVAVRFSTSNDLSAAFYRLNVLTRRRHGLPPQPIGFIRRVFHDILATGKGYVAAAYRDGRLIAAAVFFHSGTEAIFKYGASDPEFGDLGANPLILWEAVRKYKAEGYRVCDLGRTELGNPGLLRYKRAWGGAEKTLNYHRFDIRTNTFLRDKPAVSPSRLSRKVFSSLPGPCLRLTGRLIYRHFG